MAENKQSFGVESVFTIPLCDGSLAFGQVLSIEGKALNSFIGAFFPTRLQGELREKNLDSLLPEPISVQFVTPDLLESGVWKVVGKQSIGNLSRYAQIDDVRANGYVGVKVIGSGIITKFLEAYHSLYPWNGFARPDYLDSLLLRKEYKPKSVLIR